VRYGRMTRIMALGLMPLLLVGAFSLPVFASPPVSSACSNFYQSNLPGVEAFFAGYCASPRGHNSDITGGTLDFVVPSVSCPTTTCNGFFMALLVVTSSGVSAGGLVRVGQSADYVGVPCAASGVCTGPSVGPGDRISIGISSVPGGISTTISVNGNVYLTNTVVTSSSISLLLDVITTVCGECYSALLPLLAFNSVAFTNATMEIGGHSVPLGATDLFALAMHGVTLTSSGPEVSSVVVAQPTAATGSSFAIDQSNFLTLTAGSGP
jgi:hypothetical protein